MRKLPIACLAILASTGCSDTSGPEIAAPHDISSSVQASRSIPGQYIVVFKGSVADPGAAARQLAGRHGASVIFTYRSAIKGFSARMSDAGARAIAGEAGVAYVEQDQEMAVNTDQLSPPSWGIDRIDQAYLPLNGMYSYSQTGSGVNVYIIDTGVLHTHTEFEGRVSQDFTAISDSYGSDGCHWHGTHVAGTVAGKTVGVAKQATLHAVRVLDCNGSGTTSGVIAGVDWVSANKVLPAVANMSVGGGFSDALNTAVQNSIQAGVSYAVAGGNNASDACSYSPSSAPSAVTVGATTNTDAQASFSNYGGCLDLFAPGNAIYSAMNTSDVAMGSASGTSMATPHVAGAMALYLQANPSATPAQVAAAIVGNATQGIISAIGAGSPNLLLRVNGTGGGTPNIAPAARFSSSCSGMTCQFTDASTDSDGSVAAWSWNFGNGGVSASQSPSVTYSASGSYNVTLTVTDNLGARSSYSQQVSAVSQAPPTLSASVVSAKRGWTTTLSWGGFANTESVIMIRNGKIIASGLAAAGTYQDSGNGGGKLTYQACTSNQSVCTAKVVVSP